MNLFTACRVADLDRLSAGDVGQTPAIGTEVDFLAHCRVLGNRAYAPICGNIRGAIDDWYQLGDPEMDHYCLLVGDTDELPQCLEPLIDGKVWAAQRPPTDEFDADGLASDRNISVARGGLFQELR